jgi:hypothetical protein
MSAENEALVRRHVEEVYDQRKLEVVDELFASDFTLHDPDLPGRARGPEGIKRIVRTFVDAFPDLQVSLDDEMSSGENGITRWTARGTPGRAYGHSANRQPHKRDNPGYLARTRR